MPLIPPVGTIFVITTKRLKCLLPPALLFGMFRANFQGQEKAKVSASGWIRLLSVGTKMIVHFEILKGVRLDRIATPTQQDETGGSNIEIRNVEERRIMQAGGGRPEPPENIEKPLDLGHL